MEAIDYKNLGREAANKSMGKGALSALATFAGYTFAPATVPISIGAGRVASLLDTYRATKNNVAGEVMNSVVPQMDGQLAALKFLNETKAKEIASAQAVPNIKKYLPAAAAVGVGAPAAVGALEHVDKDKEKKASLSMAAGLGLIGAGSLATTLLMNIRGARHGMEEAKQGIEAKAQQVQEAINTNQSLTKELENTKIKSEGFGSLKHPGTWAAAAAIPLVGYGAYKYMKGGDNQEKEANVKQEEIGMSQLDTIYGAVMQKLANANGMQKRASYNQLDQVYTAVLEKLASINGMQKRASYNQLDQVYTAVLEKLASINGMQKQASNNQLDIIYGAVMQKLAAQTQVPKDVGKSTVSTLADLGTGALAAGMLVGSPEGTFPTAIASMTGQRIEPEMSTKYLVDILDNERQIKEHARVAAEGALAAFKESNYDAGMLPKLWEILSKSGKAFGLAEQASLGRY